MSTLEIYENDDDYFVNKVYHRHVTPINSARIYLQSPTNQTTVEATFQKEDQQEDELFTSNIQLYFYQLEEQILHVRKLL